MPDLGSSLIGIKSGKVCGRLDLCHVTTWSHPNSSSRVRLECSSRTHAGQSIQSGHGWTSERHDRTEGWCRFNMDTATEKPTPGRCVALKRRRSACLGYLAGPSVGQNASPLIPAPLPPHTSPHLNDGQVRLVLGAGGWICLSLRIMVSPPKFSGAFLLHHPVNEGGDNALLWGRGAAAPVLLMEAATTDVEYHAHLELLLERRSPIAVWRRPAASVPGATVAAASSRRLPSSSPRRN